LRFLFSSRRNAPLSKICQLRALLSEASARSANFDTDITLQEAKSLLDASERMLDGTSESHFSYWKGSLTELVWRQLHTAEALIISALPDADRQGRVEEVFYDAKVILKDDDPIMLTSKEKMARPALCPRCAQELDGGETPEECARRIAAFELVRRYRKAWDDLYSAFHGFRNRLIMLTVVVGIAVTALVLAGSLGLIDIQVVKQLRPPTTIAPHLYDFIVMLLIAVFGGIGGLITGTGEVIKLCDGLYNQFNLPWYDLGFKIAMGALTGIVGILFVQGEVVPELKVTMGNWSQIIAWALIFGAAQQLVTFIVGRRAQALSAHVPQEGVSGK